jgi:hypothetical protein
MTWDVGLTETNYPLLDQNTTQTIDGQPSENAANDCSETCLAAIAQYLADIVELPDEVHDKGWGQGFVGPSGPPENITAYAAKWMRDANTSIYHPATVAATANVLWSLLYWQRPCLYLVTNAGIAHWASALHMWGGVGSNPFDTLSTHNPFGGTRWTLDYPTFSGKLRRYTDGNFLVFGFGRVRSVQAETRFGI